MAGMVSGKYITPTRSRVITWAAGGFSMDARAARLRRSALALVLLGGCSGGGFVPRPDGFEASKDLAASQDLAGADLLAPPGSDLTASLPDAAIGADLSTPVDLALPAVWSSQASGTANALHVAAGTGPGNV